MGLVSIDPRDPTPIYAQLERAARGDRHGPAAARRPAADRPPARRRSARQRQHGGAGLRGARARRRHRDPARRRARSSAPRPAQAHPPREHERRLRAFVTRVLADADAAGFTLDDVIAALERTSVRGSDGTRVATCLGGSLHGLGRSEPSSKVVSSAVLARQRRRPRDSARRRRARCSSGRRPTGNPIPLVAMAARRRSC